MADALPALSSHIEVADELLDDSRERASVRTRRLPHREHLVELRKVPRHGGSIYSIAVSTCAGLLGPSQGVDQTDLSMPRKRKLNITP